MLHGIVIVRIVSTLPDLRTVLTFSSIIIIICRTSPENQERTSPSREGTHACSVEVNAQWQIHRLYFVMLSELWKGRSIDENRTATYVEELGG